jgi:parallel beta-helix repeat protein
MVEKFTNRLRLGLLLIAISSPLEFAAAQGSETYFVVISGALTEVSIPPYTTSQIIIWPKSAASAIPIFFNNWTLFGLPDYLSPQTCSDDFMAAGQVWSTASDNIFGFYQETTSYGVNVTFDANTADYPDPQNDGGRTFNTVVYSQNASRDIFVANAGTSPTETKNTITTIIFNSTTSFNYVWSNQTTGVPVGEVCFRQVALHELGHVIGLGDDQNDVGSVMGDATSGTDFYGLSTDDQSALTNVENQTVTGIGGGGGGYLAAAPTGLSATIVGQNVVLNWTPYSDLNAEYLTISKNGIPIDGGLPFPLTQTSYTDINAVSSLPADYEIVAISSGGESASLPVSVSVAPTTISAPTTWIGAVCVPNSVVVNSGATLTIGAGTNVVFNAGNNYTLTAYGGLTVQGTSTSPVVFTSNSSSPSPGDWGSIILNGSGANSSSISYSNINYGTEVDVTGANSVTIQNCNITNSSSYGVYLNSSSNCLVQGNTIANDNVYNGILVTGGSNNNCYWNTVYKHPSGGGYHNGVGILYSASSGTVGENDIDHYGWGISSMYGASVSAAENPNGKNNRITDCEYGLMVYNNSYGQFGEYDEIWGLNSIYNNNPYDAYVYNNSTVYAETDWWNGSPTTYVDGTSQGSFSGWYEDPWSGITIPSGTQKVTGGGASIAYTASQANGPGAEVQSSDTPVTPLQDSILIGMRLRQQNGFTAAKDYFKSYIKKHPRDPRGYVNLYGCTNDTTLPDIFNTFKALPANAPPIEKLLLGNLYQMENQPDLAEQVDDSIIKDYPNNPIAVRAEESNMLMDLNDKNDLQSAAALLSTIKSQANLITPMELQDAEEIVALHSGAAASGSEKATLTTSSALPKAFELSQNYPNPFNPTTTIEYQLPKDSRVTLKVYDVLGREVATLVDGEQTAGSYHATFDGSKFASGVYFYRLSTPEYSKVQKMALMK